MVAVSPSNPGYPVGTWTVGDIYTVAGNGPGSSHYTGDGVPATVAQLFGPLGVTLDPGGNVVIADTGNARWAGLSNFSRLLSEPLFWKSLTNTFYFVCVGGPLSVVVREVYIQAGPLTGGFDDAPAVSRPADLAPPPGSPARSGRREGR